MTHGPLTIAALAFSLVFLALGLLALLIFALRALGARSARRKPVTAAEGLDPELLAVLAAAAYTAFGVPVRIHRVHVHSDRSGLGWERAGRMDIMLSHRMLSK
jgi:glutaconyl-CoA/methylmalonyl-CoA decarboxylase subunit delta